jgi:putative ABC transport system permease protein
MSLFANKPRRTGGLNILTPFTRLPGLLSLILQRRVYQYGLTLLAVFGIILAVGLVTSASFFSEAVDRAILLQEMNSFTSVTGRPPFSTAVYVFPSSRLPVPIDQAERLSEQIRNILTAQVGLPARQVGLLVSSGGMMLRPGVGSTTYAENEVLGNARAVYVQGIGEHMTIIDGAPLDAKGSSTDALDIWVHEKTAQKTNLKPGDQLGLSITLSDPRIPLRVAGIWKATDPKEEFWFSDPNSALSDAFLVRRDDYIRFIQPVLAAGSREANWYIVLDEKAVVPKNSAKYIAGFTEALKEVNKYLPGARLNSPPLEPLKKFVNRSAVLTVILLAYNLPAFGILLYFLGITSTIMAQWQRRETAVLASRGMTSLGVFNATLIEQFILFIIGFPLGVGFGMLVARLMSYTTSFLSFTVREPLTVTLHGLNAPLIILALGFTLFSRLLPTMQASRSTVVAEEREWSRPLRTPFWYRYYLDFILILPTWYAYDQLSKRGSLAGLITNRPEDLYSDPLLILVPALFALVAALITMRAFGLVMRLIDTLAAATPWVTLHLALRQLGRQSQDYIRPLLLVIISLSIGVYTISMAASLDRWLVDRMSYQSGADLAFDPMPFSEGSTPSDGNWIPPTGDFQTLAGVLKATRVGDYPSRVTPAGASQTRARLMAIDRLDFPQAAWWRKDFSPESLGAMMNRLALSPDGVLVSNTFLKQYNLKLGDKISIQANVDYVVSFTSEYTIVGSYDYFPTAYEETNGYTVIANMDFIVDTLGYTPLHGIWLKLAPGTQGKQVLKDIEDTLKIKAGSVLDTAQIIAAEQAKLERVGIFGTLTVGFLATAVMAIMGLLVYSYASLRERVYRFAVLNALGLLRQQIIQQVVTEYTFLSLFGATAGAVIGITISRLIIPFFRYTGEKGVPLPPIIPVIAQDQVVVLSISFALIILFAEVLTIMTVFRQQLARLIKTINQ